MRRGEIVEKHTIHALFRIEVIRLLLPEAAGFRTVDQVPERQHVGGVVQCPSQATGGDVVLGAGTRDSSQRENADGISGDDDEQTSEALVTEGCVGRSDVDGITGLAGLSPTNVPGPLHCRGCGRRRAQRPEDPGSVNLPKLRMEKATVTHGISITH